MVRWRGEVERRGEAGMMGANMRVGRLALQYRSGANSLQALIAAGHVRVCPAVRHGVCAVLWGVCARVCTR